MKPISGRRIAVLFSGGDAPGMNPFLRALVRLGIARHNATVVGIKDGYRGLVRACKQVSGGRSIQSLCDELAGTPAPAALNDPELGLVPLDAISVSGLAGRPGVVLGAGRSPEFHDVLVRKAAIDLLDELEIASIVVCGGNGSLAGAECLSRESRLQVIGVPATIDNDLDVTDTALGFDTAANTLIWAIDRFSHTAGSHHRVMVLQVMGRDSGELARTAALATGAEIVVTPERGRLDRDKMQRIGARLERRLQSGRGHGIVLVAEGVRCDSTAPGDPATILASFLQEHFAAGTGRLRGTEVRASILGHLQRGGSPTAADRMLGVQFAATAWQAIADRSGSGVVVSRGGEAVFSRFGDATAMCRRTGEALYALSKAISRPS